MFWILLWLPNFIVFHTLAGIQKFNRAVYPIIHLCLDISIFSFARLLLNENMIVCTLRDMSANYDGLDCAKIKNVRNPINHCDCCCSQKGYKRGKMWLP